MSTLLLSTAEGETCLALLEDGKLTDLAVEADGDDHLLGRIYYGKVVNVVTAMDAAFVDIGVGVNAYLPLLSGSVKDIHGRKLSVGASVIVEVTKEARGSKGPMVSAKVSLAGRYAVLLATADYIGVSRKITDEDERQRLRRWVEEVRGQESHGFILRTAAKDAGKEDLYHDLSYLQRTWQSIRKRAAISKPPVCLYREADLVLRAMRDYLADSVESIITDDARIYERLCEMLGEESAHARVSYEGTSHLFSKYKIDEEWAPLLARRVDLPGGGYLIFDTTEALTAIDVNSGTFRAGNDREELARRVNHEAAVEVARQIRLRNLGGIIIVDFIDLHQEKDRQDLLAKLRNLVSRDRVRTVVVDMTPLGLVEMTRRKTGASLAETRSALCDYCGGTGRMRTAKSIAQEMMQQLERLEKERKWRGAICVEVHPDVAAYLAQEYPDKNWQSRFRQPVRLATHTGRRETISILADHSGN